MKALQVTQNRMLRAINGSKISDKVSTESMLKKFNFLSVNQLAASIKLKEVWKSLNKENYPIKLEPYNQNVKASGHLLRPKINRTFKDTYRLQKSKLCFDVDAARIWNSAPTSITQAGSIYVVKKAIDAYVRTLPV